MNAKPLNLLFIPIVALLVPILILIILLIIYALTTANWMSHEPVFSVKSSLNISYPNWMSNLYDDTPLYKLSIPGTHDTAALYGTAFCETQAMDITDQLDAGIRSLDLRLYGKDNELQLCHAMIPQFQSFETALTKINSFLKSHPSEFVISRVKEDYDSSNCTKSFSEMVSDTYARVGIPVIVYDQSLTVGSCRSKFVQLPLKGTFSQCALQDDYNIDSTFTIDDKKKSVKNHFQKSITDDQSTQLYMNYCSASSNVLKVTPAEVAKQVNSTVLDYKGKLGVVMLDFPSAAIIQHIINQNFN